MFTSIARLILRNRITMLIILFVLTGIMAYQGTKVQMSYKFSRLLPLTDSTQIDYDQFRETFDQASNVIILAVEDVDIFEPEAYEDFRQLEEDIRALDGITGVLSPISSYYMKRNDSLQKLEVVPLTEEAGSGNPARMRELYEKLPFYEDLLYSRDGSAPLIMAQVETSQLYTKNIVAIVESVKEVVTDFEEAKGYTIHTSGLPYIRMANTSKLSSEVFTTVGLALAVTTLIMFLFLRSVKATLITMLVVVLGVCWSFGLISVFGYKISMLSALIPSLIIVIGVPNCIFLINKYHAEYKYHKNKIRAVQRVIRKIGAATLLTNTTTALGFAALIFTDSVILREFGTVASINIMMVFVISIIVIPISYSFSKRPKKRHYIHLDKNWLQGFIDFLSTTVVRRRPLVYGITILLTLAGIFGATQIKTTGNLTEEYKKNDPLLVDLEFLEEKFGGVVPLEIIVDTKRPHGAEKLSFIKKLDQLQRELEELPHLSRSMSIADGMKFAKQAYYRGDSSFYELPTRQESNFISSYLPDAGSGLDMLSSMIDSTGQKARISVQMVDLPTEENRELQAAIRGKINKVFDEDRYEVTVTGASVVFLKGTSYLIRNLMISLALAILVIAGIMALLFRSFAMVLVSLIPNLFPLLMTAGIMGYFNIPLKPSTILVFSIAFGISVDDTIHFLAKYRQELRSNGWNIVGAVLTTVRETGVSMFYTSVVLFFGFSVFISSSFGGIISLGILVSITLIIAMLSNLILLPTLLMSLAKRVANKDFDHPLFSLYDNTDDEEDEDEDEDDEENGANEKITEQRNQV